MWTESYEIVYIPNNITYVVAKDPMMVLPLIEAVCAKNTQVEKALDLLSNL